MRESKSSAQDKVTLVGVPADGQLVAEHFSRAPSFVIAELAEGKLRNVRIVAFPGRGKGSPALFLAGLGVNLVLACDIGERATQALKEHGIQVKTGVTGPIELTLRDLVTPVPTRSGKASPPSKIAHLAQK